VVGKIEQIFTRTLEVTATDQIILFVKIHKRIITPHDKLAIRGIVAEILLDLLEKNGLDSFEALRGEQYLTDPQVLEIVTYVIKELDEEGKIRCRCESNEEGEYDAEILANGIRVTCCRCGASKLIPTDSLIHANEFLNADSLELE
jgi:hypothetical protein